VIGEPYAHQFLIETHSEHLVLRLQRLVREGKLKASDVSVVYVARGSQGSTAQRLELDEKGDFVNEWPGGFFSERLRELR
jgi:predicted ATPase